jgi:hypothetical protein
VLTETPRRVRLKWIQEELQVGPEVSAGEVVDAFAELGILAPDEVVSVFTVLNGFEESQMDSGCFEFWTLAKIMRENRPNQRFIAFADFLIESHRYALDTETACQTTIYACFSTTSFEAVAGSFEEFFEIYLNDASRLFAFPLE